MNDDQFKEYSYVLYAFLCRKRVSDEAVRQDFTIEFCKCFDRYKRMEGIPLGAYLSKCLNKIWKNYNYNYMKKNRIDMKYYSSLSIEEKKEWEIGVAIDKRFYMPEDSYEVMFAKAFIKTLSFRQQELVKLLFWGQLTYKEASDRMGTTKQNVSNLWSRIKEKFNKCAKNCVIIDFGSEDSHKLLDLKKQTKP